MKAFFLALLCAALFPTAASAVGFAHNNNFAVYSPDQGSRSEEQRFAESVVRSAEQFRKEIALEWLGQELPDGDGESVIYVEFTSVMDRGRTWAIDYPGREFHNVYLHTTAENATGSTLRHEITHTVLATAFPHPERLPLWVEEGIASRYDDTARRDAREQMRLFWVRAQRPPSLALLLDTQGLEPADETSYAASTSLVAYLLSLGDAETVVRFARDGQLSGWGWSLQTHYQIESVDELQSSWEAWLAENPGE
jgi:hypothetical protein